MYYDIEEEARQQEPDIDEQLKELCTRKNLVEKEYNSSEKSSEDKIKYYYSLLAIEENKSKLLDKKYWEEKVDSSNLFSELEETKEKYQHETNSSLYLYLVCGFLIIALFSGLPNSIVSFLLSIPFSIISSLPFILVCAFFFHVPTNYFSKHSKITVVVVFVITVLVLTLSAYNRI